VSAIEWSPRALRALFDIYDYIFADSPDAASRVISRVRAAVNLLATQPLLGRAAETRGRRELVVDQYVVTYRITRKTVRILVIEHGAKRR
jgi:addiction module RelE/StbE family toxin